MPTMNRRDLLKGIAGAAALSFTAAELPSTGAEAAPKPTPEDFEDVAILRCGDNDTLVITLAAGGLVQSPQQVRILQQALTDHLPDRYGIKAKPLVLPPGSTLQVIAKQ